MTILVIIPAYNEEKTIGTVIDNIRQSSQNVDILVVNDGSTDNTSHTAALNEALVIDLPYNLGIGGAMQTGYMYAKMNNYDIAVQVDADGQHDPAYIKELVGPILSNSADMVIGSRYITKTAYKSSFTRRMGMVFFSNLVAVLTGQKIKDTTSGFRAVNRKIISYFSVYYPTDYPEVDVLVKLNRQKFKVVELPVEMRDRQGGKSSITPIKSLYYMIKVSLSLCIGAVKTYEK